MLFLDCSSFWIGNKPNGGLLFFCTKQLEHTNDGSEIELRYIDRVFGLGVCIFININDLQLRRWVYLGFIVILRRLL